MSSVNKARAINLCIFGLIAIRGERVIARQQGWKRMSWRRGMQKLKQNKGTTWEEYVSMLQIRVRSLLSLSFQEYDEASMLGTMLDKVTYEIVPPHPRCKIQRGMPTFVLGCCVL